MGVRMESWRTSEKQALLEDIVFGVVGLVLLVVIITFLISGDSSAGFFSGKLFGFLLWVVATILLGSLLLFVLRETLLPPLSLDFDEQATELPVLDAPPTDQWSTELISYLDWRDFESLCAGVWHAKGHEIEETGAGANGIVDFYLCVPGTRQRMGAVKCKSWNADQVRATAVRELQEVVAAQKLKLGLLMYSGVLLKEAKDFINCTGVTTRAQSAEELLAQIALLPAEQQESLLGAITSGGYLTPSCPDCNVKLVEQTAEESDINYLACPNQPRCRYTF